MAVNYEWIDRLFEIDQIVEQLELLVLSFRWIWNFEDNSKLLYDFVYSKENAYLDLMYLTKVVKYSEVCYDTLKEREKLLCSINWVFLVTWYGFFRVPVGGTLYQLLTRGYYWDYIHSTGNSWVINPRVLGTHGTLYASHKRPLRYLSISIPLDAAIYIQSIGLTNSSPLFHPLMFPLSVSSW